MHGVRVCGQMMIGALGRLMALGRGRHLRGHQRDTAGGERRRASGCGEARLQERASLMIERFLENLVMQSKFRTRFVVTCAHRIAPRGLTNMPLPSGEATIKEHARTMEPRRYDFMAHAV